MTHPHICNWVDVLAANVRWMYYEGTEARVGLDIACAFKEYDGLPAAQREAWRRAAHMAYYEGYHR
jgi:hypothetical protein